MPAQRGNGSAQSADPRPRRGAGIAGAYHRAGAWSRIQRSPAGGEPEAPAVGVHISVQPDDGETVCAVEGAIDASSCPCLARELEVALNVQPDNAVLLDLSRVAWMSFLDVRAVVDNARRTHPDRTIVVSYLRPRS